MLIPRELYYFLFPAAILLLMLIFRILGRRKCTMLVTATVIHVDSYLSHSGRRPGRIWVYNPVFSYEYKGWKRTLQGKAFASWHNFNIGDQVELYINPADPGDFIYKSLKNDPAMHVGFSLFAFCLLFCLTKMK